ncbi:MAG: HEAT repeat domain-containing protein, partial [Planctomycetes bacterium]|nr:HEAT repeat domain-containing protein [Planctomycetota bacterium]
TFHSTVWLPVCQLVGPPIYPYVKSLLAHPELRDLWRLKVYQGMGGCGGAIAVPDLVAMIRANEGEEGQPDRVACMQGLGLTYAVEAIEPLKEGLRDPDEKVREMALEGLLEIASLKKTETIAPLCSILIPELRRAEKAKTRRLILDSLRDLTGVTDLPDTAPAWEEWWRSNGGKIE